MREIVVVILAVLVPIPSAVAEDDRALAYRLQDMSTEVGRFLDGLPPSERRWVEGRGQEATEPVEVKRVRARILELPPGAEIAVELTHGRRVEGGSADASADGFALVLREEGRDGGRIKRTFSFAEVESASLPEWKGWMEPERVRDIPTGKRVELLLLDRERVRGRLEGVTSRGFVLELAKDDSREYSLLEIAAIRKQGMSTGTKALIIAGVVAAIPFIGCNGFGGNSRCGR